MIYNKVLYNNNLDNRQNLYSLQDEESQKLKEEAKSVACFVAKNFLKKTKDGYEIKSSVPTLKEYIQKSKQHPLGNNEPFGEEKTLGYGTGFLITDDTLVTAAHVVCERNSNKLDSAAIKNSFVVFDYFMEGDNQCRTSFRDDQIYEIKEIKSHCFSRDSGWSDYAIVKLTKKVEGRRPAVLNFSALHEGDEICMLGYPIGLPLKFTNNASVMKDGHPNYVECAIDAFGGNSGSPIYKKNTEKNVYEVAAILCTGLDDFIINDLKECVSNRVSKDTIGKFEGCQRISVLTSVKEYIDRWASGFKLKTLSPIPKGVTESGCYLLVHCQSCTSFEEPQWKLWKQEGVLYLDQMLFSASCTSCNRNLIVDDVGMYNCHYGIEGKAKSPKEVHYSNQNVSKKNNVMKILGKDSNDLEIVWHYLKVTLFPEKKNRYFKWL